MQRYLIRVSVIVSFAAMIFAVPIIQQFGWQGAVFCPFRTLTKLPCPTCGFLRVFNMIFQGQIKAAFVFQPFILIIVVMSGIAAVQSIVCLWQKKELNLPGPLVYGIFAALALSWGWNLWHGI
jgi:hypothetical protein